MSTPCCQVFDATSRKIFFLTIKTKEAEGGVLQQALGLRRPGIFNEVTFGTLVKMRDAFENSLSPLPVQWVICMPYGCMCRVDLRSPSQQCPHSGLTRSKLIELVLRTRSNNFKPLVKSLNSCSPRKERGFRLVIWAGLKAYLKQLE